MMKIVLRTAMAVVFLCAPILVCEMLAQGPPVGGTPPCWPPPCIPIDGGLGLLIAAGAIIGGKKALDVKRSTQAED